MYTVGEKHPKSKMADNILIIFVTIFCYNII